MSNVTTLRLRVLPRYPARIEAANGLTVEREGADLVVKPDFGALAEIFTVESPNDTYFWTWRAGTGEYDRISFQKLVDGVGSIIIGPNLIGLASVTSAADKVPYFIASDGSASVYTVSSFVRGISSAADAAAFRSNIGAQAYDAGLASIAGLTTSADQMIYTTGSDTYATTALTAFARSILDDANAGAVRSTLGLGGSATLNVGTTAGTVAAGDDTRVVNANTLLTGMTTVFPYTFETRRYTNIGFEVIYSTATTTDFGHAAIHAKVEGNRHAIVGEVVQNNTPGNWSFPEGITGYGKLDSAGNQVFGAFFRQDLYSAGVATTEFNTFNYNAGPPGTFPPDRSFGTTATLGIPITVAAGGDFQSLIGIQIGPEGSDPNSFVCGIYTSPDGITGYGYIIDCTSTQGPQYSGVLNNTGQGSNVHLQLQTKGTAQASNAAIQHLNSGGTVTFKFTQDGSYYIGTNKMVDSTGFYVGATKVLDNTAWTAYTPTVTAASGAITSYTASGRWRRMGKAVFVDIDVTITNNGTGAGQVNISLPAAALNFGSYFVGREAGLSNKLVHGSVNAASSTATVFDYSGAYPGATNARLVLSGRYEV